MATNESAPTGESELTAKAREVLSGLSDAQREQLATAVVAYERRCREYNFGQGRKPWAFDRAGLSEGSGTKLADMKAMARVGVVAGLRAWRRGQPVSCDVTDLGREVARILSEVQS